MEVRCRENIPWKAILLWPVGLVHKHRSIPTYRRSYYFAACTLLYDGLSLCYRETENIGKLVVIWILERSFCGKLAWA